jgi:hypothetical protein
MPLLAQVVADDADALPHERTRDPGADASEHAGDEEPLRHTSWYTVTTSV